MANLRGIILIGLVWFAVSVTACMSPMALDSVGLDPARVADLEARIEADSTDAEALRNLGAYYMQQRRFDEAGPMLYRAYTHDSSDAYARFYYGLALEHADSLEKAASLYTRYRQLPRRPHHRRLRRVMAARYEAVLRAQAKQELDSLIALEQSRVGTLPDSLIPPNTVAVFPIQYIGGDERYAPLGQGLTSLLSMDLARVAGLRVLERQRLQVLMQELGLADSTIVEGSMAPRIGRLLRAQRLIGGVYAVSDDERVQLELALRDIVDGEVENVPAEDVLSRFFALEKDLVFRLIDEMGIVLSEAERLQIEYAPTRNLQALMAYSRGVVAEDAGRFSEATRLFQQAGRLDPGFGEAVDRAEINEGLQEGGAGVEEAIESVGLPATSNDDLVRERHVKLGGNIGSLMVPGQDARDPASEGAGRGTDVAIERPPPPPIPSGGN